MTDYRSWEKFDADQAIASTDAAGLLEDQKQLRKKEFKLQYDANKTTVESSVAQAEVLQAQNAVAQLKKAGGMGRRRQNNKAGEETIQTSSVEALKDEIVDPLMVITEYLLRLLRTIEDLQHFTESKGKHSLGYSVALRCLRLFSVFNQLKYAAIHDIFHQRQADEHETKQNKAKKVLQDLLSAESYVLQQSMTCLSLFALSVGDFVTTVDCTRFLIKHQGESSEPGLWIMRALSCLGIGAPFLCNIHLKSILGQGNSYPGLSEAISYIDDMELLEARLLHRVPYEWYVEFEIMRTLQNILQDRSIFLSEFPDLVRLSIKDCQCLVRASLLHEYVRDRNADDTYSLSDEAGGSLDSFIEYSISNFLKQDITIAKSTTPMGRLFMVLSQHQSSESDCILTYLMAHRLFYEAQVLYLESMFSSAEHKYCAMLVLLGRLEANPNIPTLGENDWVDGGNYRHFLSIWKGVTILNISGCRYQRGITTIKKYPQMGDDMHKNWHFSLGSHDSVEMIKKSSTLELCEISAKYIPSIATTIRKNEILKRLNRPLNPSMLDIETVNGNAIVGDYGQAQVLSQLFSTGFPIVISSGLNKTKSQDDYGDAEFDEILSSIEEFLRRNPSNGSSMLQILELYRSSGYNIFDLSNPPRTSFDPCGEKFVVDQIMKELEKKT